MNRLFTAVLLIAPLLFAVAESKTPASPKISVNVTCDKPVYQTKEPVTMTLTVINTGSATQEYIFNNGKKYDFYLYRGTKLIWKWSGGKMFTQALSSLSLNPNQPLEYIETFDQTLPSGKIIPPGRYRLKGAFCTGDQEYLSGPITIKIRR